MAEITKTDLKALGRADRWYLYHANGKSGIRCVKQAKHDDPFATDIQYDIDAGQVWFRNYADNAENIDTDSVSCFADVYGDSWKTVVSLLRVGDSFAVEWLADCWRNGYLKDAKTAEPLHADGARFIIMRPKKDGRYKHLTFDVATSICADNTARMIRGIRYRAAEAVA